MSDPRASLIATVIVAVTGVVWGIYWLPVRALGDLGLGGAWGTAAITLASAALLAPLALGRGRLRRADPTALASIALGGGAFALYSIGFLYGRVAIVILLWFLSPVWSALVGRWLMGWPTPRLRLIAIVVGLAGLFVMLGADGSMPLPRSLGEWMTLIGGLLWSFSTTGIRVRPELAPSAAAFVFACGAAATALLLAPALEPPPTVAPAGLLAAAGLSLVTGGLWWCLSLAGLMWATARLDPARVAILLMTEVLVGAATAALFVGETLSPAELLGGGLVLLAGVLEVWPAGGSATRKRD